MTLPLNINGKDHEVSANPTDTLLSALRGAGFFSVRFGSHDGRTGAAAVLVDGQLVNSDVLLAGQASPPPLASCIPSRKRLWKPAPSSPATAPRP